MNQAIHRLKLFLCFFSGEDDFIIRKCNRRIQVYFALIGLFVISVFIGCWMSATIFMSHLFEGSKWVSLPIGIVWAALVANLYLLLLYTISPALLPVAKKKKRVIKGKVRKIVEGLKPRSLRPFRSFSFLFRITLISFLAIVIAQPFNVMFFARSYREADKFAATIRDILHHNEFSWALTGIFCILFLLPVYFKFQVRRSSGKSFNEDFGEKNLNKGIGYLRQNIVNPVDFDSLQKEILSVNINSVKTSDFYFQKALIEFRIILEEYQDFKRLYNAILMRKNIDLNRKCWRNLMPLLNRLERIDADRYRVLYKCLLNDLQEESFERYEYWADPPFRTKYQRNEIEPGTEAELLRDFYR